jgi:hypothetical protein
MADTLTALLWVVVGAVISMCFTAAFQNPLDRKADRLRHRVLAGRFGRTLSPARARERRHRDYLSRDLEELGLFTLLRWSQDRPLEHDPRLHRLEYGLAPGQDWFDSDELARSQAEQARTRIGINAYAYDMTIDHREHPGADQFIMSVATSNYGDLNAIGDCIGDQDMDEFVRSRLHERGAVGFLRTMPPTRLSIQVSVVSTQRRVLATRRSHAVGSAPGVWSLGPNETLVPTTGFRTPGLGSESLFDLASRCLAEECGLLTIASPAEIGPIHITWFGVSTNHDEGVAQNVLALTTCSLPESEIADRIGNAHSNFEADGIDWIDLSLDSLLKAMEDPRRTWISFSHLACRDLWRYRAVLEADMATLSGRA